MEDIMKLSDFMKEETTFWTVNREQHEDYLCDVICDQMWCFYQVYNGNICPVHTSVVSSLLNFGWLSDDVAVPESWWQIDKPKCSL